MTVSDEVRCSLICIGNGSRSVVGRTSSKCGNSRPQQGQDGRLPQERPGGGYEKRSIFHARILMVDDDQATSQMLGKILQNNGYEVDTAFCGREAIAKAERFIPDLLVSDICKGSRTESDPQPRFCPCCQAAKSSSSPARRRCPRFQMPFLKTWSTASLPSRCTRWIF